MKPLRCDSCHTKFGPTERYVGIKRPDGIRLMCLGCYTQNGGDTKHIKTRFKGDANKYLENPKTRDELYQLREEFAPKYKEFIKGHKVIRKTLLTPEEVQRAWDTPEKVGGGWHLVSKFDYEEVAHDSAMAYELSGYRVTVVPTKRILSGTSVGGIASSKTFRERETMWAVMIYDPQRDIKSTKPEPFTEEWKSAPYEEGTFETLHRGYPRPRGLYMYKSNPIHVGWGPLVIGPRKLNGISPGLLIKLKELFDDPQRKPLKYGEYDLIFIETGILVTGSKPCTKCGKKWVRLTSLSNICYKCQFPGASVKEMDIEGTADELLVLYEANARIGEILSRMDENRRKTGKVVWFVRPLYHKVYNEDEPIMEVREQRSRWILEEYPNGVKVGIIQMKNKYIPFIEQFEKREIGRPHITWSGAVTELINMKGVKPSETLMKSKQKKRGRGIRRIGGPPREKAEVEIIPLVDTPEVPGKELPTLLEEAIEKEKQAKEKAEKPEYVPLA